MGLQVEIVERSSVIVVTLTGPTDIEALKPLHDALHVAAGEGQTVVLDLRELSHASGTGIIEALGPAVATLKLVVPSPTGAAQPPVPGTQVYTSVDAAIDAIRDKCSPTATRPTPIWPPKSTTSPTPVRPHDRPLASAPVQRREPCLTRSFQ